MNRRHRFARFIAVLVGLPLVAALLVAGAFAAVAVSGVPIDASRWRDALAQRVGAALGRPVVLQGAIDLRLGLQLSVRAAQVRILNPPGFTTQPLLSIDELRAHVGLLDVLRGRPRLRSVEADDVGLWLERAADGRSNWSLAAGFDPAASPAGIDLERFQLRRVGIHYHDARTATRHFVDLDELSASSLRDQPLRLVAHGRLQPGLGFSLTVDGGSQRVLLDGADAWPFSVVLKTAGARLQASGALHARQRTAGFRFGAEAEDLAPFEALLGAPLAHWGRAALHGTVSASADAVRITGVQGRLGASEVSGQLALAFAGARPRLSGALVASALDLRALLAGALDAHGRSDGDDAALPPTLAWRDLSVVDVELDLQVQHWLGLPVDIQDARFALHADKQGLRVPMSATLAGVPVAGGIDLDTSGATPALRVKLSADEVVLAIAAQPPGEAGAAAGRLGRLDLRLDGRGQTLASLARDLELSLEARRVQWRFGRDAHGAPFAVSLDTLQLAARRGERLRGQARGQLFGEPASLTLQAGTVSEMLRAQLVPLALDLKLPQARLRAQGKVWLSDAAHDTTIRFDFEAPRAGELARWLRVAPESTLPVLLRGQVRRADHVWTLESSTLEIGRSQLSLAARRTFANGRPMVMASVRGPRIDVRELSTLRAGTDRSSSGGSSGGSSSSSSSSTIGSTFSAFFDAADVDADIDVDVQHLLLGDTDVADLRFVARRRDDRWLPAPVTGRLADAPFTAQVGLDLGGELPMASLELSTGAIDIGVLLGELGAAEDIDGRVQALELRLLARGRTLHELADHSSFDARLRGGGITVRGPAQRAVADIRVDELKLGASAGKPLRLRLDGSIERTPLAIAVDSGTLGDFARDASRVPFALAAQAAGARLTLDGEVPMPLGSGGKLTLALSGERLDTLNGLARVELPPWGPWSFRGPIRMTPTGYELQGLEVVVGRSRLGGSGKLDMSGPRPQLDLQLAAPSIQLDDFVLPQRLIAPSLPPGTGRGLRGAASRVAGRTDTLLSAAFLRRFDANIDVKAKEVLSGSDRLADGTLQVQLKEGRLHLDPATVNLPGGTLRLSIAYDLKGSELEFAAAARVERFDYGIIARRLRRADDLRGLFSLDLELAGTAPSLDTIMRHANGKVDFAVWPTELRSGVFNLWSVNLVLQLLPLIDPGATSQVNCIVGRFDLNDGKLRDNKALIDTTAVRMRGAGHADLKSETLEFVFRPRAKGLALFRLQTPLRVTGTLDDQRFGFERSDVATSVLRLITSPILVPIEWFTLGPLPRDGNDVCTDPLRAGAR